MIDFKIPTGTPIRATADGEVIFSGQSKGGYGIKIDIQHED
ncbi:MAG: M23 family metallopeptidase, partial [Bacteroidota bacterium]